MQNFKKTALLTLKMVDMKIPWAIPDIQKKDTDAILQVLETGWLSMGSKVKEFEEKMKKKLELASSYATAARTLEA